MDWGRIGVTNQKHRSEAEHVARHMSKETAMFEIEVEVWQRLKELDKQMAPLRSEAQEILDRTRPGFRPYNGSTFAQMYLDRAVGPEAFYARQEQKAAETRRRNALMKELDGLVAPKAGKGKRKRRVRPNVLFAESASENDGPYQR
jgi:hypothetical protein